MRCPCNSCGNEYLASMSAAALRRQDRAEAGNKPPSGGASGGRA